MTKRPSTLLASAAAVGRSSGNGGKTSRNDKQTSRYAIESARGPLFFLITRALVLESTRLFRSAQSPFPFCVQFPVPSLTNREQLEFGIRRFGAVRQQSGSMGAWTVYLILTFNYDHRHLTRHPAMSYLPSLNACPSLDACPGLDASPARTTPKRTDSDITIAAAKEGHTPLDHESPPRKRQKTEGGGDQATSASNLGAPGSALLDLPLDVLLEVCCRASSSRSATPSQASHRFGAPHRLRAPHPLLALARSHFQLRAHPCRCRSSPTSTPCPSDTYHARRGPCGKPSRALARTGSGGRATLTRTMDFPPRQAT